ERGVVELVPRDRRRYGPPIGRSDGVRRDERLDRLVLRVVEASLAAARAFRPLPRDEIRDGRPDRPADPLDPVARVGERVLRLDRDPGLDSPLAGDLRV